MTLASWRDYQADCGKIWKGIQEGSTEKLTRFLIITFADLKKYKYYYWFAFPAFAAKPAWEIDGEWQSAGQALSNDTVRDTRLTSPERTQHAD